MRSGSAAAAPSASGSSGSFVYTPPEAVAAPGRPDADLSIYEILAHTEQCALPPFPSSRCSRLILFPSGQVSLSWYTSWCVGGYSGESVLNGLTVAIAGLLERTIQRAGANRQARRPRRAVRLRINAAASNT